MKYRIVRSRGLMDRFFGGFRVQVRHWWGWKDDASGPFMEMEHAERHIECLRTFVIKQFPE